MTPHVLIATLGSEPQVVTLVLDLLRAKGYAITEVVVVHTLSRAVQPGLQRLSEEFALPGVGTCRFIPVENDSRVVADILSEKDTAALLRTLYRTVLAEKRAGRSVHLSIAGGRKPMAMYGMVVAQLLFDEDDHVWHLLTEDWRPGDKRIMHVRPGDGVSLVPIPVLRWSAVSPMLTELAIREDPWEAIQTQQSIRQQEDQHYKREFIEQRLTKAERELVRLACLGIDNAAIARRLYKSEKTVANQFTVVYEKLREWRGLREDVPVTRLLLVAEFAVYFSAEKK